MADNGQAGLTPAERKQIRSILWERMGVCMCGTPENSFQIIMDMLARSEAEGSFYEPLNDGAPAWVELMAHVLGSWELLEHGSSIGYAWLTEDGKLLLRFLRQYGIASESWPEWATVFSATNADGTTIDPADLEGDEPYE